MHLTLSLLLLARHASAASAAEAPSDPRRPVASPGAVVVEVVPGGSGEDPAWCSVAIDRATEELVIKSSMRTWDRMSAVFEDETPEVLRIAVAGDGSAARVAPLLREANPRLMVVEDPATNTILVGSASGEA
jgi:hypothetical protein